jgi:hypothetical protein
LFALLLLVGALFLVTPPVMATGGHHGGGDDKKCEIDCYITFIICAFDCWSDCYHQFPNSSSQRKACIQSCTTNTCKAALNSCLAVCREPATEEAP